MFGIDIHFLKQSRDINERDRELAKLKSYSESISGLCRRLAAFAIDCFILIVLLLLFGFVFFEWAASLGREGRLIGFGVALLYFGIFDSHIGGGQSPGKRILGLCVTDRNGNPLSPARAALRTSIIAAPCFLLDIWFDLITRLWYDVWPEPISTVELFAGYALLATVFGGLSIILYLFVFNWRTRRSLHDIVGGSIVIQSRLTAPPVRFKTPLLHLILSGLLAIVSTAYVFGLLATYDPFKPDMRTQSVDLQDALNAQHDLATVRVYECGRAIGTGKRRQYKSILKIDARFAKAPDDYAVLARKIIDANFPGWDPADSDPILILQIHYGFHFGMARWIQTYGYEGGRSDLTCEPSLFGR